MSVMLILPLTGPRFTAPKARFQSLSLLIVRLGWPLRAKTRPLPVLRICPVSCTEPPVTLMSSR